MLKWPNRKKYISIVTVLMTVYLIFNSLTPVFSASLDKVGTLWVPFLEWSISNPSYSDNPFDVVATVTFVHSKSGETHTTEMFYDGHELWKFRFTGTQIGIWTFISSSNDPDLNDLSGKITINENPNPNITGFITNFGNKWGRTGINKAFVPQFVMYADPKYFYNNPAKVDADIQTFLVEHGFNGFHVMGKCHWFDINKTRCTEIEDRNPDPRTFETLEMLITKVHAAGGVVHLWLWGDEQRRWTPKSWGNAGWLDEKLSRYINRIVDRLWPWEEKPTWMVSKSNGLNGSDDKRLQRYIAARLGPLPGWSMGYGFDLWEWVTENDLHEWHQYMHEKLGWPHYLGARASKNKLNQLYEGLDYSSYEQHKPHYDLYVKTIEMRPHKPSFSEDRFRIRDEGRSKDYTMEETRRGLWHSTMAGGIANIWGNLSNGRQSNKGSAPYPKPYWIKTNTEFFKNRFTKDLTRCTSITDGLCLKRSDHKHYIFYKEDTDTVRIDLSDMDGPQIAIAVDTKKPYQELNLEMIDPIDQSWKAPYISDWAIAVGNFSNTYNTLNNQ